MLVRLRMCEKKCTFAIFLTRLNHEKDTFILDDTERGVELRR